MLRPKYATRTPPSAKRPEGRAARGRPGKVWQGFGVRGRKVKSRDTDCALASDLVRALRPFSLHSPPSSHSQSSFLTLHISHSSHFITIYISHSSDTYSITFTILISHSSHSSVITIFISYSSLSSVITILISHSSHSHSITITILISHSSHSSVITICFLPLPRRPISICCIFNIVFSLNQQV